MTRLPNALRLWLPFTVIGAALVLLITVSVQQTYRQNSNDPQIQMAEDAASALAAGASPQSIVPSQKIDIGQSLAPFVIVTDVSGKVLASSATLNGSSPLPPLGSLEAAKVGAGKSTAVTHENRITWQTANGTRLATVIEYYGGSNPGYVIVGRNMRELESRVGDIYKMAALDFLGLLAGTFLVILVTV